MTASGVTATLDLALQASGLDQADVDRRPRLLSDKITPDAERIVNMATASAESDEAGPGSESTLNTAALSQGAVRGTGQ